MNWVPWQVRITAAAACVSLPFDLALAPAFPSGSEWRARRKSGPFYSALSPPPTGFPPSLLLCARPAGPLPACGALSLSVRTRPFRKFPSLPRLWDSGALGLILPILLWLPKLNKLFLACTPPVPFLPFSPSYKLQILKSTTFRLHHIFTQGASAESYPN